MRTSFPVDASPEAWAALADPTRLAAALPGCRSVTHGGGEGGGGSRPRADGGVGGAGGMSDQGRDDPPDGPGGSTLHLVTEVAVASVRGLWSGTVVRLGADAVRVRGSGVPGTVDLVVRAEPDRTALTVEGTVEGPLATVGTSVLAAALRRTAEDLLAALAAPPAPAAAPALTPAAAEPSVPREPVTSGGPGTTGRPEAAGPGPADSSRRRRRLVRAVATVAGLGAVLVAGRQWVRRHGGSPRRDER